MNITLSADKRLIEKSRDFAKKHNTTLNNLIREYLKRIVNEREIEQISLEFENLAKSQAGESPAGYHFNRNEIYSRGV